MSNAEEGIARVQAAATKAQGTQGRMLQQHQARSIAYIDERILTFVFIIAFIGLIVVWATATSPLVLYGSLATAILLALIWGFAQIKRIERLREERQRQAQDWKSDESS